MEAIWQYREKKHDLVGTTINIHSGQWHRKGESYIRLVFVLKSIYNEQCWTWSLVITVS